MIDALGIEYIYVQFVSVTGRVVGKGMPADHWERAAERGIQLFYGATANVVADRQGRYLGYGPASSELVAMPEPGTFAQLPWDPKVARVFGRLFRNREERTDPGGVLTSDSRGNLARLSEEFAARHDGMRMRVGTETEMMWLRKDGEGVAGLTGATKPYCYHIDQFEELRPVMLRVLHYARALGLDMIQGDHEDAPGQLELNFAYDEALRTADRLVTYRQICRQVAREFGLIATFMAKPFMNVSASGCHHNLSLWRGGGERVLAQAGGPETASPGMLTYADGGTNLFVDADGGLELTEVTRHSMGGMLKHLPALTAIGSSTVNSYRRLWDTGFWAPLRADWGFQNRTCALRISAPGRVEYRAADSMVNPYLMASGLLMAIDDGLRERVDPGPPERGNSYEQGASELPMNLGDALEALAADPVIRSAMPGEMYGVFNDFKRSEWETFLATVTDWDLDNYLDYVP